MSKHRLSKKRIIDIIGTPQYPEVSGSNTIGYSFAPSQVLSFYFGPDGKTIHVEGPGIEFLSHYDRNWAFIRLGMTKKEVNTKFGHYQKELDGEKKWQYEDPTNDPHLYNIYFDENDKVIKLDKTEAKKD